MFKLIVSYKSVLQRESRIIKNVLVSLKKKFLRSQSAGKKIVTCVRAFLDCVQFVIPGGRFWPQCVCMGGYSHRNI